MNKHLLSEEFLRMQKLAGIETFNFNEFLLEFYLQDYCYRKGILIENLSEGILDNIKDKLKDLKPTGKLISILLAKLRTYIPEKEEFNKIVNDLYKYEGDYSKESLQKWVDDNFKTYLEEKFSITSPGKRLALSIIMLLIYLTPLIAKMNPAQLDRAIQDSAKIEQTVKKIPGLGDDPNSTSFEDSVKDAAKDLKTSSDTQDTIDNASNQANDNPISVSDDGKTINVGYDTGDFKIADEDGTAKKVADDIIKQIGDKQLDSLKLGVKGLISNTPGIGDDDPNGPDKAGLGDKRLEAGKSLAQKVADILKGKFKNSKITVDDDGTNVKDPGKEVKKGSKEAKKSQASSFTIKDLKTSDKKIPTKVDLRPDAATYLKGEKPSSPDGNKYYTILGQILPLIIDENVYNSFSKNLEIKKDEVINDAFIDRKVKELRNKNTLESNDAAKILLWARGIKKSPSSLADNFKKLDPNISLVRQKQIATKPGEKGKSMYTPGSGDTQKPKPGAEELPVAESISLLEITNLILEAQTDFSLLPGYNESKTKSNLGLLVPIYVYSWNVTDVKGKNGKSTIEYISQEYKSSFDTFTTKYPVIAQKVSSNITPLNKNKPVSTSYDKLQNKNKTQSDVVNINKTLKNRKGLHAKLKRINNADEFRDLVLAIMDETDSRFSDDKQKVKSTLFSLRNRIQEIDTRDTSEAIKAIMADTSIKNLLKKINTVEEAIQLILRDIIPYLDPNFIKDKVKLKNSIISAVNQFNKENK